VGDNPPSVRQGFVFLHGMLCNAWLSTGKAGLRPPELRAGIHFRGGIGSGLQMLSSNGGFYMKLNTKPSVIQIPVWPPGRRCERACESVILLCPPKNKHV
jgi:hypothetical protein